MKLHVIGERVVTYVVLFSERSFSAAAVDYFGDSCGGISGAADTVAAAASIMLL